MLVYKSGTSRCAPANIPEKARTLTSLHVSSLAVAPLDLSAYCNNHRAFSRASLWYSSAVFSCISREMKTARRCSSVTDGSRLPFALATPAAFSCRFRSRLQRPRAATAGWKHPADSYSSVAQWPQHEHAASRHSTLKRLATLESALRFPNSTWSLTSRPWPLTDEGDGPLAPGQRGALPSRGGGAARLPAVPTLPPCGRPAVEGAEPTATAAPAGGGVDLKSAGGVGG